SKINYHNFIFTNHRAGSQQCFCSRVALFPLCSTSHVPRLAIYKASFKRQEEESQDAKILS
ncbi:hypothetical protein, partial [uncultured Phascolarctobacterium sp.]|uniref:hypothetical protein n=1 Tax=uncultured Phascolarctobacterium sp. TaxID=512296 RepID=UPI0025FB2A7E